MKNPAGNPYSVYAVRAWASIIVSYRHILPCPTCILPRSLPLKTHFLLLMVVRKLVRAPALMLQNQQLMSLRER